MRTLWRILEAPRPAERKPGQRVAGLAAGVLLVFAGDVAQRGLGAYAHGQGVLALFSPAVIAAAVIGGVAPALASAALGAALASLSLGARLADPIVGTDIACFLALSVVGTVFIDRFIGARRARLAMADVVAGREAFLQSVLDTVPDAMIIIDHTGAIQSFSATAEQIFGWSAADIEGRNVSVLMPANHKAAHDAYVNRFLETGERRIIGVGRVVTAIRKDGSSFPVELCVGEARASGRRFFTGFLRDLTVEEDAKRRVQELQSELVHISRLSAMGEMAAALAHELNQPLTAIANYLNAVQMMVKSGAAAPDTATPIAKAADQALRAGEIIRRLRTFVDQGETERRPEDLRTLIEEAASLALVGAREKGVEVRVVTDPRIGPVLVDKIQVQQVLLNLVRNALEAMADAPRRELRILAETDGGTAACVSVVDTGSGVDPEILPRLFLPFVTTKHGTGMGVGLSICKTIVEAQGGRIWAEPNPGGGAAFRFTLPVVQGEDL